MEGPKMPHLPADLLAQPSGTSPTETLRQDLEDCLKEYSDLDLLVELLQNGLDAIDPKRYRLICEQAHPNRPMNRAWAECRPKGGDTACPCLARPGIDYSRCGRYRQNDSGTGIGRGVGRGGAPGRCAGADGRSKPRGSPTRCRLYQRRYGGKVLC